MPGEFKELPEESKPGESHTADFEGKTIDVYKLIKLYRSLELQDVEVNSLKEWIERGHNFWIDKNGNWLGLSEIIEGINQFGSYDELIKNYPEWEDEIIKVKKSDYKKHPIILIGDKVVDGIHRLTKTFIDGAEKVGIKKFDKLPEGLIIDE